MRLWPRKCKGGMLADEAAGLQLKNDQSRLVAAAHEELLKAVVAEGMADPKGAGAKEGKPGEAAEGEKPAEEGEEAPAGEGAAEGQAEGAEEPAPTE